MLITSDMAPASLGRGPVLPVRHAQSEPGSVRGRPALPTPTCQCALSHASCVTTADTALASAPCSLTSMVPNTTPAPSAPPWWPRGASPTYASRLARLTTTPWSSASTARSSKSAGARPFTAVTSRRSASSRPKPTRARHLQEAPAQPRRLHRGRTPQEILDNHKKNKAACQLSTAELICHLNSRSGTSSPPQLLGSDSPQARLVVSWAVGTPTAGG